MSNVLSEEKKQQVIALGKLGCPRLIVLDNLKEGVAVGASSPAFLITPHIFRHQSHVRIAVSAKVVFA
jgi:hypothetical protein